MDLDDLDAYLLIGKTEDGDLLFSIPEDFEVAAALLMVAQRKILDQVPEERTSH